MFPELEKVDPERYKILSGYFTYFRLELKKPGCTRETLWKEYVQKHPGGYGSSQFNEHLSRWLGTVKSSGKLTHKAGDALYVDYTGKKLHIIDKQTGSIIDVEVFVGILPASQYTYVEASRSQKKEDFIATMNRCLMYFEGVPKTIVTDNLKSAVNKASKYEAILNKSLRALAVHYGTSLNPTRSYSPQDKALVEGAVTIVYQRIFYPLNKMTFFSIDDLNKAVREKLIEYNNYLMKRLDISRIKQFLDIEKPYLGALPAEPYEIKEYKKATVSGMGYIFLNAGKNYYTVPYRYIGRVVEIQYNSKDVEIYYRLERIAFHKRSYIKGYYTKKEEHLSSAHKFFQDWSPEYFIDQAKKLGSSVESYVGKILEQAAFPEIAYKQCLGVINLKSKYADQRIDNACRMALEQPRYGYRIIENILINKMDLTEKNLTTESDITMHCNIRGSEFYN